jgi:APA family basic amino acid/polyamine antiporter
MLILVLISCAFIVVQQFIGPEAIVDHGIQNRGWLESFLLCFVPVFFTYGGYQQTMNFGGDVQQASRTIPKAISRGMIIVMVLYMGVNFSYYSVLGIEGMASSKTLAADMIGITFGKAASDVLSVFMFFAVMTYLNVSILSNPRVYYAMAEDKVMPSAFLSTNQRTGVLTTGVLVFCAMIVATLFFIGSFQKILEYVMFFDSISLITAAGAIFLLRKRRVGSSDSEVFNMQGYPLVPIAYIVVYAGVNISVFIASPSAFGWGALLFLLGFPLFYLLRKVLR